MFTAELSFLGAEAGGYRLPFTVWPARVMLRFEEDRETNYGAAIVKPASSRIEPGDVVTVRMWLLNEVAEARFCLPGVTFSFGDMRDRGLGRIIELVSDR